MIFSRCFAIVAPVGGRPRDLYDFIQFLEIARMPGATVRSVIEQMEIDRALFQALCNQWN